MRTGPVKNREIGFTKSVITLMTGAGVAQLIPLLVSPILTRLYTPEEFALYAIFMSLTAILGILVTGRFEMAALITNSDVEAISVSVLAAVLSFSLSIVLLIVISIWAESIATFFKQPNLEWLLIFLPFSVFITSINQILINLSNSRKNFFLMSKAKVIQSVSGSFTSVSLGGFVYYGLVLGQLVGVIFSSLLFLMNTAPSRRGIGHYLSVKSFFFYVKKYNVFPKISLPHAILTKASSELPILMINYFFNSLSVGSYSLANRVLVTPLSIITSSFSQVFIQRLLVLKNSKNKNDALKFYHKIVFSTLIVSLPFFIFAFILMPYIFEFVFGAAWRVAGEYSQLLIPMLYFRFVGSIVSTSVIVFKQQKRALLLEIISVIGRFLSLVIGGWLGDIYLSLLLFSITSTIVTVYRLFWYNSFIKREVSIAI